MCWGQQYQQHACLWCNGYFFDIAHHYKHVQFDVEITEILKEERLFNLLAALRLEATYDLIRGQIPLSNEFTSYPFINLERIYNIICSIIFLK